jgi:Cu+-exporting ATPase
VSLVDEVATVTLHAPVEIERLISAVGEAGFDAASLGADASSQHSIGVDGMHCASCARAVEEALRAADGVEEATVDLAAGRAHVRGRRRLQLDALHEAIEAAGYTVAGQPSEHAPIEDTSRAERRVRGSRRRMGLAWSLALPIVGWMLPEMLFGIQWPSALGFHLAMTVLAAPVLWLAGGATLAAGWRTARRGRPSMDTLIALGSLAAFVTGPLSILAQYGVVPPIMNYAGVSAMIMAFHLTGRYLETRAMHRTTGSLRSLLKLTEGTARVRRGEGEEMQIPLSQVEVGDLMLVRPGERVPTDGIVERGVSDIDEALITGESVPVRRAVGAAVVGGTVNGDGPLEIRATGVGRDTFLARMVQLVREAQATKVPIQALADRVTTVFVPVVLAIAAATFAAWLLFPTALGAVAERLSGILPWVLSGATPLSLAIYSALAVLVIACPCALGLATPTALVVGVGRGATHGVLIRSGAAMQALAEATHVALDKTGTITKGTPQVVQILAAAAPEHEVLRIAAALESTSTHPFASAVVARATERGIPVTAAEDVTNLPGLGIRGRLNGSEVWVGRREMVERHDERYADAVRIEEMLAVDGPRSTILVGHEHLGIVGGIALADILREDAAWSVRRLKEQGIALTMLTGDTAAAATPIASAAGIFTLQARLTPEEKLDEIRRLQHERARVAMVGDGINDAPALKAADVGVAMGAGTDIAIESADITLTAEGLVPLVAAVELARATFRRIRGNLRWAVFYNLIALPLAILGVLHPLVAEAAMALSSINVVSNSLRLRRLSLPTHAPLDRDTASLLHPTSPTP